MKNYNNYTNFNFKDIFLKLTEYTVPAGYEDTLLPILKEYVPNLQKDSIGNYFTKIGDSKTLFTSHLDTFSKTRKKVNHIIDDGNMIKTDGTSVLGGDNKNGVLILFYLIKQGVPGTYYFFIGEESIVNGVGCYGSTNALKNNKDYFKQFNKAIAFDRRGKGSFVIRQAGRYCASNEFADAVINEYEKQGLEFGKDNAYRTDSAIFMDIIPEITNISSGGLYEHTYMEATNIEYVEKIAIASSKIDWDNLPIVREIKDLPFETIGGSYTYDKELNKLSQITFNKVSKLMGAKGFICLNKDTFFPGKIMYFNKFLEDKPVKLSIYGNDIKCLDGHKKIGKFREGDFNEFKRRQKLKIRNLVRGIWQDIVKQMNTDGLLSNDKLNDILFNYDLSYKEFKDYMESIDEGKFIKFNENNIECDVQILHLALKKKQLNQEQVLLNKLTEKEKQEEIHNVLGILGKDWLLLSNVNKTRFLKFIENNQFEERFFAMNYLDHKNGNFDDYKNTNELLLIKNYQNIYDIKTDTLFVKK